MQHLHMCTDGSNSASAYSKSTELDGTRWASVEGYTSACCDLDL